MTEECQECGKEFDTERGLNIHKAQKYKEEKEEKETSSSEEAGVMNNIVLTPEKFGGLTFLTGLFLGMLLGGVFLGGIGSGQADVGLPSPGDNGEDSPSGGDTVDIDNTGIGSEEMSFNWSGGTVALDGRAYAGSEDANTVIVSYEDFTCGFCGRHNRDTFPSLVENYVNEGEVQYFYKHFPVLGGWNRDGAVAAECAAEQSSDAFWSMKNYLYQNQDQINVGNIDSTVKDQASELGLDTEEFNSCYDNQETEDKVDADLNEGRNFNHTAGGNSFVSATPSFIVYDKESGEAQTIVGAQPVQAFEDAIEQ